MSRRAPVSLILAVVLAGSGALVGCAGPMESSPAQFPVAPPPPVQQAPVAAPPPSAVDAVDAADVPGAAPAGDDASMLIDDDDEGPGVASAAPATSPALAWSDAEIDHRFHTDLASIGPASVGPASAGALVNGVQMQKSELWQLTDPGRAWGTQETVDALQRCIARVNQRFPGAPPISIGHLSAKNGGHLSPHRSHQSGRDADVGYYYKAGTRPFIRATAENLDLPRTWALVKTAVRETTVEMILIDHAVQRILADYAIASGEDAAFVDEVFQVRGKNARAPIRHVRGHDNHIHFRFHNPVAEAMGRRVARFVVVPRAREAPTGARLASAKADSPADTVTYAQIRARSGDTLVILARRYGTTVEEIQRANSLSGNAIRAGMTYRIPQKGAPAAVAKAPAPHRVKGPARVAARKAAPRPSLQTPKSAPAPSP